MGAFSSAFTSVTGCYFHLTLCVVRKVHEIGMKADYERDNNVRITIRCLPALAMIPASDVVSGGKLFEILADDMSGHEKCRNCFHISNIHTYLRPGRGERYGSAIFPIPMWIQFDNTAAREGLARTTNAVVGLRSFSVSSSDVMVVHE